MTRKHQEKSFVSVTRVSTLVLAAALVLSAQVHSAPVPGGTLDPLTIPKYVSPMVIPPEMPKSTTDPSVDYQIAVQQFQ